MSHSFLIIDGEQDFRRLLRHHINARWPDARISEYDPLASGQLPEAFTGADHDVVLLGNGAFGGEGQATLSRFLKIRGFPPVVYFGDAPPAVSSGASAAAYVAREGIQHATLIACLAAILCRDNATATQAPDEPTSAGTLVKGYRLLRQLAAGEYATVYLAVKENSTAQLALKVLTQFPDIGDGTGVFDRFLHEYEIIADLDHPNIVRIFELGVSDEQAFIAMEYLPGGDLKQRMAAGMKESQALGFCRQIAGALGNLHSVGILHRDLKPGNIMLRADDSIALIDFGLAKRMQHGLQAPVSDPIFGTPHYMSPEQGRGGAVDERSDLYSVGIILHEMLTGIRPFRGRDPMEVIFNHSEAPLPILPDRVSRYQPILDKLLAKKPEDRCQSAMELLAWL